MESTGPSPFARSDLLAKVGAALAEADAIGETLVAALLSHAIDVLGNRESDIAV